MTIEEMVLERLRDLPADKKKVVLEFVESLKNAATNRDTLRSLRGLWANFGFDVTEKDIADARRTMWNNFPREIP
jgi:hypothetical protein